MNKKAAIELSVNFLVIIIISLVVLSSAILITRQIFKGAKELKADLDTQTEAQIESLLEEGRPVAVAFNRKKIQKGDNAVFGVGVLNVEDIANFNLKINFSKAFDIMDEEFDCDDCNGWLLYDDTDFELEKNEGKKIGVLVNVPKDAKVGTYIFNIKAYQEGSEYYTVQKIYVEVP